MEVIDVLEYLENIPTPKAYDDLKDDDKEKYVFAAIEEVNDILLNYQDVSISKRMAALQALYNVEGEDEGIAMMRRQGLKSYQVKDVTASLDTSSISPNVLAMIEAQATKPQAKVGRLI